jgi:hypothetical protein
MLTHYWVVPACLDESEATRRDFLLRSEWATKGSAWACFFSPAALGETRLPLARVVCTAGL